MKNNRNKWLPVKNINWPYHKQNNRSKIISHTYSFHYLDHYNPYTSGIFFSFLYFLISLIWTIYLSLYIYIYKKSVQVSTISINVIHHFFILFILSYIYYALLKKILLTLQKYHKRINQLQCMWGFLCLFITFLTLSLSIAIPLQWKNKNKFLFFISNVLFIVFLGDLFKNNFWEIILRLIMLIWDIKRKLLD